MSGMTEDGAWFLWGAGVFLLSCVYGAAESEKNSRWIKPIIAIWCAWTLPPFVAAWLRLMLS
jgi:hypothetical protein